MSSKVGWKCIDRIKKPTEFNQMYDSGGIRGIMVKV